MSSFERFRRQRLRSSTTGLLPAVLVAASLAWVPAPVVAQDKSAAVTVEVVRITRVRDPVIPLSLVDEPIEDNGRPGVELGLEDNVTTGSFLGHEYLAHFVALDDTQDVASVVAEQQALGRHLFLLDLDADELLEASDAGPQSLFLNVRASDDVLRNEDCRANLLHMPPSRAMLADALVQYLAWKQWDEVVLVTGRHPVDALYAAALARSIERFGLELVERKDWTSVPGARRTDSGHHNAQQEIPVFTRFKDHDVVLVADEFDEFGEYLPYRTASPRLVAGTQGLTPTLWHRSHEQWGATQLQRRFRKLAGRDMTPLDQASWLAMRAIGESVTALGASDAAEVRQYMLSDRLTLAGFKGVPLSFRNWNGQLRQPVLLAAPRMLISVSPQEGYLHQFSELDTLGYDQPESGCQAFQAAQ